MTYSRSSWTQTPNPPTPLNMGPSSPVKLGFKAMQVKRSAASLLHSAYKTYRCIEAVVLTGS